MTDAKKDLASEPKSAEAVQQTMGMVMMANGVFDQLLAANSQDEFNMAAAGVVQMTQGMQR